MWRDGKLLVCRIGEPFPDRCIKTNLPAEGRRLKQGLRCQPGWATLTQVAAPPGVGEAVSAVAGRRTTIDVGVSPRVLRRRRRRFMVAGLILAASFGAIAWAIVELPQGAESSGWLLIGGVLGVWWGLFSFLNASQLIVAKRMTKEFIWLRGAGRDFLADLPEWPGDGWVS